MKFLRAPFIISFFVVACSNSPNVASPQFQENQLDSHSAMAPFVGSWKGNGQISTPLNNQGTTNCETVTLNISALSAVEFTFNEQFICNGQSKTAPWETLTLELNGTNIYLKDGTLAGQIVVGDMDLHLVQNGDDIKCNFIVAEKDHLSVICTIQGPNNFYANRNAELAVR